MLAEAHYTASAEALYCLPLGIPFQTHSEQRWTQHSIRDLQEAFLKPPGLPPLPDEVLATPIPRPHPKEDLVPS